MHEKAILTSLIFSFITTPVVYGLSQRSTTLTNEHLAQISANCRLVQSTLGRIHSNDAVARVNLGRNYDAILTKLMVPLNTRIELNRMDSTALVATSGMYRSATQVFSDRYVDYESELTRAIQADCVGQPAQFYEYMESAREKRKLVAESVQTLGRLIQDYSERFESFSIIQEKKYDS